MIKRSLFLQFFGPQMLILLASLGAVALYAWHAGWLAHREERVRAMYAQVDLVSRLLFQDDGTLKAPDEMARICHAVHRDAGVRVTVIAQDGHVLADSDADSTTMSSHADRQEIVAALTAGQGWSERYSATLHCRLLYAARAIRHDNRVVAVVRVAARRESIAAEPLPASRNTLLLIALVCLVAASLSYVLARRVIRPVSAMRAAVARIGAGELDHRLAVPSLPPLAELARAINQTTGRLQDQLRALAEERSLRERILSSMAEGVLAIDARGRVVGSNQAACRLLAIETPAPGTPLHEVIRCADVLALVDAAAGSETVVERDLLNDGGAPGRAALWARAAALRDTAGKRTGTLVVLGDLSHIRRLERVRQEFVANVSHELRTPITSIIGFVETLLEGETVRDPETVKRFLSIVRRQAGQLHSIVTDLLMLSRLENQGPGLLTEDQPLAEIVGQAIEICQARAAAGQVALTVSMPDGLRVQAHAGLLEQALVNLIDNAIQYGGSGGRVEISAEKLPEGGGRISVRDYGPGIAPEHIDRLFERFYRIDKGRSRELGGTGLGLAIVRHIALAHGGNVSVASEPGQGCVFSIWLAGSKA